jgi:5-methylcytosine-specific restriction enzyme subunit McrC
MIQIREYGILTDDTSVSSSLDVGIVSKQTFNWLLSLQERWKGSDPLLNLQSRHSIKLGSYVGFLQSPSGESIEVLPKIQKRQPALHEIHNLRSLLKRMLLTSMHLKPREADVASLQVSNTPMHEWLINQFLVELTILVGKGLKFDYKSISEESRFIRGKLELEKQIKQGPGKAASFHIKHDVYSVNRLENRLLKHALTYAFNITKDPENWRLANELNHLLSEVSSIFNPEDKLDSWDEGKLMQSYSAVKPWCELIIRKMNPNFQFGGFKGIALMFAMEFLFESYVEHSLRKKLSPRVKLKSQASSQYLINDHKSESHISSQWFCLKPDLLLSSFDKSSVLDTKWKLLNSSLVSTKDKYGLKQSDFYQLYAYGQKYMKGEGNMMLIYPSHLDFTEPLSVFSFDSKLHLWVVPFDLYHGQLVEGEWNNFFILN